MAWVFEVVCSRVGENWRALVVAGWVYALGWGFNAGDITHLRWINLVIAFLQFLPIFVVYWRWGLAAAAITLATACLFTAAVSARSVGLSSFLLQSNLLLAVLGLALLGAIGAYVASAERRALLQQA